MTGTISTIVNKYAEGATAEVNCAERIHLCGAACCRLKFYLSAQDVKENVAKYRVDNRYEIEKGQDGWCTHTDRRDLSCMIHDQRPAVCRRYDCSGDARIWEDFDGMVINPNLWQSKESNHDGTITEGTTREVVDGQDQGSAACTATSRGGCRGCDLGKSVGLG